jgi:hypothetical protein
MKEKGRLAKWNIYYREFDIHPLCNFYIRCERIDGKTDWYLIYKWETGGNRSVRISRQDAKETLISERKYFNEELPEMIERKIDG